MADPAPDIVAFHRGALGDSVLVWPRLRAAVREGRRVWFVTDRSKALLAEREVGVVGVDAEQARFTRLWRPEPVPEATPGVAEVWDFLGAGGAFAANLRAMFPGARVVSEPPPRGGAVAEAWLASHPAGAAPRRDNPRGPVVVHVGAGAARKRWPLDRWALLAARLLGDAGTPVRALAGEAEAERFDASERAAFRALGGRSAQTLDQLAEEVRAARLFIGADTGPTHLAAQLGVPTLALFGPTDPTQWAPVGPAVRVLAPPAPAEMHWLDPDRAASEARALLCTPPPPPAMERDAAAPPEPA